MRTDNVCDWLVASFGEYPPFLDTTYDGFTNILMQNSTTPFQYSMPKVWTEQYIEWETQDQPKDVVANEWISVNDGVVRGRVIGGNLNTIQGIWGSQYMPPIRKGDILFIEDSLKSIATMEKLFSMLKVNGVFERVAGIILGKHEKFDDMGTLLRPLDILLEVLGEHKLPILTEFDCCHTHPMLTLPIGVEVELDTFQKRVTITEPWLQEAQSP